jgi:hypothetical protein
MANRGRPSSVACLLGHVKSGPVAKERLSIILASLAGTVPVSEACRRLAMSRTLFQRLRKMVLRTALQAVEPRPRGRPVIEVSRQARRISELEGRIVALNEDLAFARVREELALLVPWAGRRQKKTARIRSSRPAARPSMPPVVFGAAASRGPPSPSGSA